MNLLQVAVISTGNRAAIIIAAGLAIWVGLAGMTASHGNAKGFGFWPLFVCTVFLGFPLVLLGITIGDGIRQGNRG